MILTDYYRMAKQPDQLSKYRLDCIASTNSHPQLEALRNKQGALFFYFTDVPEQFTAKAQRRADRVITKGKSISSVYIPNVEEPYGYGDIRDTSDAILFIFSQDYTEIELFVARGQRNNRLALCQLLSDGELDLEMGQMRRAAINEIVTNKKKKVV